MDSVILYEGRSIIAFANNSASSSDALHCDTKSGMHYKENTTVIFISNSARKQGAAVYWLFYKLYNNCDQIWQNQTSTHIQFSDFDNL